MMAENKIRGSSATNFTGNEVQVACAETKKRPNILRKNADRLKSRLSRSPKRRAGTPEPEQRVFTDESEKDTSDGENLGKTGEPSSSEGVHDERGKQNAGIRRFITRRDKKVREERSRSLEKTLFRDNESEDDFETIRKMHKSKELEEEKRENEKMAEDSKPRGKEEPKAYVIKDMPPLIEAPKDAKRKRHKSLPSQDFFLQGEAPRTPILKQKIKVERRKSSSSEEDRERGIDKCRTSNAEASQTGRKPSVSDLRKRRSPSNPDVNNDLKETVGTREPDGLALPANKEENTKPKKLSFFSRIFSRPKDLEKFKVQETEKKTEKNEKAHVSWTVRGVFKEWKAHVNEHRDYINRCQKLKNRCITDLFILLFICGCGGLIFRFVEGAFESFYKCGVKRVKRDFIDSLWKYSQYMLEEDWKSQARRRLMEFENQLHSAHEAGMTTYSGQKSWSFLNAVVYCLTVVTTIGYGHISPSTTTGRAITIIYAIFGIPMFLILLADFGKLFTRGIKFLWAFVRRLYYTGSCRKVRKTAPVQEMMKGMQIMYDFAKTRKFSNAGLQTQDQHLRPPEPGNIQCLPETPGTPNWSNYEIDDEFNLPISVAISILLTYIFFGAFLYWMWEDWSFFESFYFVFISMSTIGFGDFVPQHPIYMMLSIVYLVFGLALTSMCINVVQEKLSDTFRQASAKLGTTIGLSVDEPVGVPQTSLRTESNQIKPQ